MKKLLSIVEVEEEVDVVRGREVEIEGGNYNLGRLATRFSIHTVPLIGFTANTTVFCKLDGI